MIALTDVQTSVKNVGNDVLGMSRNVWLAGLGVVATVGEESKSQFTKLVSKGESYGKDRTKGMKTWVTGVEKRAKSSTDKVEKLVQKRVESGLHMVGIPSRDEIRTLIDRVEKLSKQVEKMQK